jgi:hypothetical protein
MSVPTLVEHGFVTFCRAWVQLRCIKRASVLRVLALAKAEILEELKQHWELTVDPADFWVLGVTLSCPHPTQPPICVGKC